MKLDLIRLSDFKPLRRVMLPGLGELPCSGLVVLVGPNSSGKSQLLRDIYACISGTPRNLVVASEVRIAKPVHLEPFLRCLEKEGYFSTLDDDSGTKQMIPRTMYGGTGQAPSPIQFVQARQWYESFDPESPDASRRPSQFLQHFGRLLVTALFLDRRLTSSASVQAIDFASQPPQHDLHALVLDDDAQARLEAEMVLSFGRGVWLDHTRGSVLSLRVGEDGPLPKIEHRLSHRKMSEFRLIEDEGDGMKSYVATCVSLLLGRRPVCLIDEPEMCLHPPQARNLGRFIGSFGASVDTATIVATHSSHLLRGVLESGAQVQIIRLTRRDRMFSAHLVPAPDLAESLARPTLRAEAILDGIFAEGVVVVEADADRLVYQAVWETIKASFRMDLHFSTVGGAGGIAGTFRLYRMLKIPVAVIADLDILIDQDQMLRVLTQLVDDSNARENLLQACLKVAQDVRGLSPEISSAEVSSRLSSILSQRMDWDRGDDVEVRKSLRQLASALDRVHRLKAGGVAAYSGGLAIKLKALVEQLTQFGLFLVPVGELEDWLREHEVGASKSEKPAWSNAAAEKIQTLGKRDDDVWRFISEVARFLSLQPATPSNQNR